MLEDPAPEPLRSRVRLLWARYGRWSGPVLRLGSYGWAYAAQFTLTLILGVDVFAVYVAATALGMVGAYGSMAGVTDLLARQWTWLSARRTHMWGTLMRFVGPRLLLAFVVPALLALVMERQGLIHASGDAPFWLLVGAFGVMTVTVDVCGVLLACLGRPSFHLIVSNGLLGTAFFAASGWTLFADGRPDVLALHVGAQIVTLTLVGAWLFRCLLRTVHENEMKNLETPERPDLRMGVTVTAVHMLEILRNHLPILMIQAVFHSALAAAVVASLRFSRSADVMTSLVIAQYTRAIVSGGREALEANHAQAQRLCVVLTGAAMIPLAGMILVLCHREGLGMGPTLFVTGMIAAAGVLRQMTTVEIWIAKVATDPGPALRVGVAVEAIRFAVFALAATFGNVYAVVAVLVAHDLLLLAAMLNLSKKSHGHA